MFLEDPSEVDNKGEEERFGKIIIHHSASRFSSQNKSPTLARHLSPSPGGVMGMLFPLLLMGISLQKNWQHALSKGKNTHCIWYLAA